MKREPSIPRAHALTIAVVCFILALLCFGLILSGCSGSPTAPTSVTRFAWAAAPGCSPTQPIPEQIGMPLVWVRPIGFWEKDGKTYQYEFKRENGLWLVCAWEAK